MPIFIENNYGPNIENFSGTIEINTEKKTIEMKPSQQAENAEIVPVNTQEPADCEQPAEPAAAESPAEESLDLFLVTKDTPRDTCEMVLDSIFRASRSKKMVCEKLYQKEGMYFRLGAVGREERAKWLNQFPSNWQGHFLADDMKYWRKPK